MRTLVRTLQSDPNAGMSQTIGGTVYGPVAVDHILYSTDSGKIFFSDQFRGLISAVNLDGTGKTVTQLLVLY